MRLICDVKEMEDVVTEMKYDACKAPLGEFLEFVVKLSDATGMLGLGCSQRLWETGSHSNTVLSS